MNNTNIRTIIQHNYEQQNNNYNNNYNNNHTQPGVCIVSPEDTERICEAYTENIGNLNAAIIGMIASAIEKGLTVENILMAIEETAFAPRPSAAYLRAILRNWCQYGVSVAKARHEAQKDSMYSYWQRSNPALQYYQREYRDEDFDGSAFMKEVAEMKRRKAENENF